MTERPYKLHIHVLLYILLYIYHLLRQVNLMLYNAVRTCNSCTSRPDVCQCLVVQTSIDKMSNKPNTFLTNVADESKLRSVNVRDLWSDSSPVNWVPMNYAHAFSVGIKSRHCTCVKKSEHGCRRFFYWNNYGNY